MAPVALKRKKPQHLTPQASARTSASSPKEVPNIDRPASDPRTRQGFPAFESARPDGARTITE